MVLYILFNTAVLTLIGIYRIFQIYLRPIERMVNQAESYGDEEDFFFSFRREDNELNRLSKSLNRMLGRIAGDRQKLQENVASLAKANTDLKIAQNEIVQAEKMASIGRLAAGVAHEIGNPIGIVLGYLDLLRQRRLRCRGTRGLPDPFRNRNSADQHSNSTIIGSITATPKPASGYLRPC